jgi:hypothetical protein
MSTATALPAAQHGPSRSGHLRWVRLGDLQINGAAQREFREPWATEILANFDLDSFQIPTVSIRNGVAYVVDGQHGLWALRHWLDSEDVDDQEVQVWAHEGLTEEQEADLFLALNHRKTVAPLPKFRAAITAGRPTETDVNRIVLSLGCRVTGDKVHGAIAAVGTLLAIYNNHGPSVLAQTIATVRDAYGDGAFEAAVLSGVALVYARYANVVDGAQLTQRMHDAAGGSKGLLNDAHRLRLQTACTMPEAVAAVLVDRYNAGTRSRNGRLTVWWKVADS